MWSTSVTAGRGGSRIEKEGETLSFTDTVTFFTLLSKSRRCDGKHFHFCAFGKVLDAKAIIASHFYANI